MRPHVEWYPKPLPVHLKDLPDAPLSRATHLATVMLSAPLAEWVVLANRRLVLGEVWFKGELVDGFKSIYGSSGEAICILGGKGSAGAGAYKVCSECGRPTSNRILLKGAECVLDRWVEGVTATFTSEGCLFIAEDLVESLFAVDDSKWLRLFPVKVVSKLPEKCIFGDPED